MILTAPIHQIYLDCCSQFTYSWFLGWDLFIQPSLILTSINHGSILGLEIPDMTEKAGLYMTVTFVLKFISLPSIELDQLFPVQYLYT